VGYAQQALPGDSGRILVQTPRVRAAGMFRHAPGAPPGKSSVVIRPILCVNAQVAAHCCVTTCARRIKKIYRRDAEVIYPPVDTAKFRCESKKEDFYLTASRFVPYKKIDLIAEAFSKMPDKKLVIIGEGTDEDKIKAKCNKNVKMINYKKVDDLAEYMKRARAFVFAAEEDFGISVIEALSCGTPVIALNKGGTAETIIDGKYGIHFSEQTTEDIVNAVSRFEKSEKTFDPQMLSDYAKRFDRSIFEEKIRAFIINKCDEFFKK